MTLTYVEGEQLLEQQVRSVNGFAVANVSRARWKMLNDGKSDHYAILKRGPFVRTFITGRQVESANRTIIQVWQRVNADDAYDKLLDYCNAIISRIDQYRKLSDTDGSLRDANLTGGGDVKEQWRNNADGPSWLSVELFVDWSSDETITFAE